MTVPGTWPVVSAMPSLGSDAVHLWRVPLAVDAGERARLFERLSGDERQRAARFHFDRDRNRYVVRQGVLRELLAAYLEIDTDAVTYETNAHGKPRLAGDLAGALEFNLSSSRELALIAVCRGRALGVDVEYSLKAVDVDDIASGFFAAREASQLASLPTEARLAGFYRCWTRKEAWIKAVGMGLYYPLDGFCVSLLPDEPAQLLSVAQDASEVERWSLHAVEVDPGYTAAFAIAGRCETFERFSWPPASSAASSR